MCVHPPNVPVWCPSCKAHTEVYGTKTLHIVGENELDSTAALALEPNSTGRIESPDFINTQAVYARVLCQGLAYPVMQPVISQLFHRAACGPQLRLASAGRQIIPLGRATFADVTLTVATTLPGAVCIGFLTKDGTLIFAPDPQGEHEYDHGDVLIIISREQRHLEIS